MLGTFGVTRLGDTHGLRALDLGRGPAELARLDAGLRRLVEQVSSNRDQVVAQRSAHPQVCRPQTVSGGSCRARSNAHLFASRMEKPVPTIPVELLDRLLAYGWPGNIRELMNVMERASILATDGVLPVRALNHLNNPSASVSTPKPSEESMRKPDTTDGDRLEDIDRRHILAVLESTNWIVGGSRGAAARLGIKRPTLIYRMKKLGIARMRRED